MNEQIALLAKNKFNFHLYPLAMYLFMCKYVSKLYTCAIIGKIFVKG